VLAGVEAALETGPDLFGGGLVKLDLWRTGRSPVQDLVRARADDDALQQTTQVGIQQQCQGVSLLLRVLELGDHDLAVSVLIAAEPAAHEPRLAAGPRRAPPSFCLEAFDRCLCPSGQLGRRDQGQAVEETHRIRHGTGLRTMDELLSDCRPDRSAVRELVGHGQHFQHLTGRHLGLDRRVHRRSIDNGLVELPGKLPDKELQVIMNFFNWQMVFRKKRKIPGVKRPSIFVMEVKNLLDYLRRGGLRGLVRGLWESGKLFCTVAWYAQAYPSIRKKYDLYAKNFGRTDWD